jgi:hypothetical protein
LWLSVATFLPPYSLYFLAPAIRATFTILGRVLYARKAPLR